MPRARCSCALLLLLCLLPPRHRPSQWLSSVVQYIGYSAPLKYLLVVLKPRFGGRQLAALKPDVAAMAEAVPALELTGVIVATGAAPGALRSDLGLVAASWVRWQSSRRALLNFSGCTSCTVCCPNMAYKDLMLL